MRDAARSPSEYYIRFLISQQKELEPQALEQQADLARVNWLSRTYLRELHTEMDHRPDPYRPDDPYDHKSRQYLKHYKIYDLWYPTKAVREAMLIATDNFLREKLEPLLLSCLTHHVIARKLRRYTSIALTSEGVSAFGHYFWNRQLLTREQWMDYVALRRGANMYQQSLMMPPDLAMQHLPWVLGLSGPQGSFNSAEASARLGHIAYKYALELEHKPATAENAHALRNCMVVIEKADQVLRRSDVALRDVLRHFQKFKMRLDEAKVIDVQQLTDGNFSKSGEGTDLKNEEDF